MALPPHETSEYSSEEEEVNGNEASLSQLSDISASDESSKPEGQVRQNGTKTKRVKRLGIEDKM